MQNVHRFKDMERITGMIVFIASSAPGIKLLLSQIYISIANGIGENTVYLTRTNIQFRQLPKDAKSSIEHTRYITFTLSETSRQVHPYNTSENRFSLL